MHAARNSGWLLVSFLAIVMAFPGGRGQAAGDSPVVEAARRGDVATVRALIAKKANVTEPSRDGSTAHGCPATIVASAGRSPRSASFTARETPSSPGVTWTIAVRARRSASGPFQRGGSSSARWICIPARPYR